MEYKVFPHSIRRKNAITTDCEINFLSRTQLLSSTRSAARHASLIRSWHNDRASRVAGSESSSVLQPATTRILPRRPVLFMKFPVTYECPNELTDCEWNTSLVFLICSHTVRFRDTKYLVYPIILYRDPSLDVFLIYMKVSINFKLTFFL